MRQTDKAIVGFDARPLFRKRDGIGTYTEKTIIAAAKIYKNTQFIGVIFKGDDSYESLIAKLPDNISIVTLPFSWRRYRAFAELGFWRPIDSYLQTTLDGFVYFNFVALPLVTNTPIKRLVIHDATFLLYPETMTARNVFYLKKYVNKSAKLQDIELFTISKTSARIISDYLHAPFKIAAPGTDIKNRATLDIKDSGTLFFVGTLEPRKNLHNVVTAFNEMAESFKIRHPLVIAGKRGWKSQELIQLIQSSPYVTYVESPSDKKLEELYRNAAGFILASTYEGFGIPALDATQHGLPVITSKHSPMSEFLGTEGAIYVDPTSISSIIRGLRLFGDMKISDKRNMVKVAAKNSESYNWESTAQSLFAGLAR